MPRSFWHAFSKGLVAVAISSPVTWHNVSWAIDWAMRFSAACSISEMTVVGGCVNWTAVAPVGDGSRLFGYQSWVSHVGYFRGKLLSGHQRED